MAIIGWNSIGSNTDTVGINWEDECYIDSAYTYTAASGDTVTEFAMYSSGGPNGADLAIYVISGGLPTTRVGSAVSISIGSSAGWYTASASISLTAGTTYGVAIRFSNASGGNTIRWQNGPGGNLQSVLTPNNLPALPATWTHTSYDTGLVSYYATVTASASSLTVASCTHSHTASAPALFLTGVATPDNAVHAHTASNVVLPFLTVDACVHAHTATIITVGTGVYTDDFNRADTAASSANALGPNWNCNTNTWHIASNHATKVTGDHYTRFVTPMPSVNHFIEVVLNKADLGGFNWFHLRAQDNTAGSVVPLGSYEAGLNTTVPTYFGTECEIGRVDPSGTYTVLGRGTTVFGGTGPTYKLRFQAIGDNFELYVDDILCCSATDTTFTGSYVGLNCYNPGADGAIVYEDFRAGVATLPASTLTVASCVHAHTVDSPTVTLPGVLTVAACVHAHTVTVPALTRVFNSRYPVTIAGRKWLDQTGAVYLMRTFSSWAMAQNLTNAEITTALNGISAQGFNSATVCIGGGIDFGGWHRYTNAAGQAFWTGSAWQLATPSSALGAGWSSVDWVMTESVRLGMTINLSIFYSWGTNGAAGDINGATTTQMYNVGYAVATRYAAYPNIVWHIMFDDTPTAGTPGGLRVDAYFHGINDVEGAFPRLRWAEPNNGSTINNQLGGFTYANWSANGFYSYFGNSTEIVETSYNEAGATTIPTGDVEPPYDGSPHYGGSAANQGMNLRYRSWATFIEGGSYANYGHEDWWPFHVPNPFGYSEGLTWPQVPTDVHTIQQSYCWTFVDRFLTTPDWAPNTDWLTAGQGTGSSKAAVGRGIDSAAAYFPDNTGRASVTVDTTVLIGTGNVRIRWFDPYTGNYTVVASTEAPSTGRVVTYPAAHADGTTDWVLLVENIVHDLTVASALHGHTCDVVTLGAGPGVIVAGPDVLGHVASVPALTQTASTLTVANCTHIHLVEIPGLFSIGTVSPANAVHAHHADSVVLPGGGIPGFFLGTQQITKLYVGTQEIPSGYVGDDPL